MGADGGICWIRVRDRQAFDELTSWFAWMLFNSSAYAYKGAFAADVPSPPPPVEGWVWLEGAFGTDCEFDFDALRELAETVLDEDPSSWTLRDGTANVRDYTLAELEEALITEPTFDLWPEFGMSHVRTATPQAHHVRNAPPSNAYYLWWGQLGVLLPGIIHHLQVLHPRPRDGFRHSPIPGWDIPETFRNMTLREWAKKVAEVVDFKSIKREETWT